jgi:hypothetical protein
MLLRAGRHATLLKVQRTAHMLLLSALQWLEVCINVSARSGIA